MRPVDVKLSTWIDFGIENDEKDAKFKIVGNLKISKNKNIFAKGYGRKKFLWLKKVKNPVPWT